MHVNQPQHWVECLVAIEIAWGPLTYSSRHEMFNFVPGRLTIDEICHHFFAFDKLYLFFIS